MAKISNGTTTTAEKVALLLCSSSKVALFYTLWQKNTEDPGNENGMLSPLDPFKSKRYTRDIFLGLFLLAEKPKIL